jgi:hypothetical protein
VELDKLELQTLEVVEEENLLQTHILVNLEVVV